MLFERGAFKLGDTRAVSAALAVFALGLPALLAWRGLPGFGLFDRVAGVLEGMPHARPLYLHQANELVVIVGRLAGVDTRHLVGWEIAQEGIKAFNAATQKMEPGMLVPVVITAFQDKSFTFEMNCCGVMPERWISFSISSTA